MNGPSPLATASLLVAFFACGKCVSWGLYQLCWRNHSAGPGQASIATWQLLKRWRLWPLHAAMLLLGFRCDWNQLGPLHLLAVVTASLVTWGAVFRFGAVDRNHFHVIDRLMAVAACVGVWFSPAWLYPSLMVSSCLQYTVASWPLGPGYSNLLGFEFARGSAAVVLACVTGYAAADVVSLSEPNWTLVMPLAVIAVQGSHYVNHGLAKAWLGRRWYSWVLENRVEYLAINAYHRGWCAWLGQASVLRRAEWVARFRIPLCASVMLLECGFFIVLTDPRVASALYLAALVFHLGVFVMTGLAEMEHVVNHATMIWLFSSPSIAQQSQLFGLYPGVAVGIAMALTWCWVGWNRLRMLDEFRRSGTSVGLIWADPFDHLMAWWDSPLMRMFSYVVVTPQGRRLAFPVSKLSPYDTALTDIHTHIMILRAHRGFDPQAETDQTRFQTGVWGLVIATEQRDRLYALADGDGGVVAELKSQSPAEPWHCDRGNLSGHPAESLWRLFAGINHYRHRHWFRCVMRYPHFPGEDLATDICPLMNDIDGWYTLDEPISKVILQRLKTFATPAGIQLIEQSDVGVLHLEAER